MSSIKIHPLFVRGGGDRSRGDECLWDGAASAAICRGGERRVCMVHLLRMVWGLMLGVWGLRFGVGGLGYGADGLGCRTIEGGWELSRVVEGLGLRASGSECFEG